MKEFLTVCPRNCYSTCTFRVFTEDGKVKRILPYGDNLATPEGPCIKGLSYLEREYSPERILYPLQRQPDGSFERIGTDEALALVAARLSDARGKHGPHSVLFYKGSGCSGLSNDIASAFWRQFGGATTTYGNLCWPAGLEAVRLTLGEVKHNLPWDLANASMIILWGKNSAETNVQEMIHIEKARDNGARVVVIDPRRTITADKADILIRPRPGTDAALALAMARVIIDRGMTDNEFIREHVTGFEKFKASLQMTPDKAQEITGIPADEIIELAMAAAGAGRLTIIAGYGLQRYTNGGQTIRSILSIPVITGMLGKPGCGFNFANLQSYIFDDIKEPLSYYPDKEKDKPFRRAISMATFGPDFFALEEPAIEVAWVERGNPLIQLPGSGEVRKAFESIPFKVVVEQFMTDTAAMADIIFPAKGIFEQADVVGSYWNPYAQYKPKVTDLPGEVIPESEIYWRLAQLIGIPAGNETGIPAPDEYDNWLMERISHTPGFVREELFRNPVIPEQNEHPAYSNMKFDTPSGKIELWSEVAARQWGVNPLPAYEPPDEFGEAHLPFRLMTPNIASRIHSQFGNLEAIKNVVEEPVWEISVADARRRGLKSGDTIRIFNSRGEVTGRIRVTARVMSGSLVFPNGIWLGEGGGVNRLIAPSETDMGHGAAFHNTRADIEKVEL
ncbi:MAG: molybdopterin-dependent oxidoreductase [Bacteroidales bacterium]|jgi:anaerobic selenocysteine-containing dehydrogenase|nr:molybdopterin-dependent oxidoreductase [Bacteroidales bacterium]